MRYGPKLVIKIVKPKTPQFPIYLEEDPIYLEGIEKGIEKGIEIGTTKQKFNFVQNLLLNTDFSTDKIASLANVTLAFVEEVKTALDEPKI